MMGYSASSWERNNRECLDQFTGLEGVLLPTHPPEGIQRIEEEWG
jgi:hypothetical protein